ncbi:MAG: twin-arginine translocase TatA/TatE family subunit [Xanthomonadaceae bacterium]|nr:twin-arginine translocase TatA/TatE family subunit [Xanthomonadaceae bacterium]
MFGISGEHLLIFGAILLIFGPRRVPELGHSLGKAFRNFKDAISGVEEAQFKKVNDNSVKPDAVIGASIESVATVKPQPQESVPPSNA